MARFSLKIKILRIIAIRIVDLSYLLALRIQFKKVKLDHLTETLYLITEFILHKM